MTNPTQSETLLPCPLPWCGGDARTRYLPRNSLWQTDRPQIPHFIECTKCGLKSPRFDNQPNAIAAWNTRLQSIPEPLLDEGLVSVRIDPATAQTLMDWNVLHTTDAGWVIDLDIWRSALSIPRLEAGRVTEEVEQPDFVYFECNDCGFSSVQPVNFSGSDYCPLCDGDCGRSNRMSRRIARITDKPEGKDARLALSSASAPDGPALTELGEKSGD